LLHAPALRAGTQPHSFARGRVARPRSARGDAIRTARGHNCTLFSAGPQFTPPLCARNRNCYGAGVNEVDLQNTADFFVSSGLRDAGYDTVSTDDGWMGGRDAAGRMIADPVKFKSGMPALAAYMHARGLKLGVYSAASSVVCSGRVGSLYHEDIDAKTFASWGIDYVKFVRAVRARFYARHAQA
jgi:hypothetical protein